MTAIVAAMDSRTLWWVTRGAGLVAWLVMAAAVVWGLLVSTKLIRRRGVPAWILDLHRYLGTLTVAFVIVHVGAIWLDSYVTFGAKELFVPFASTWKPHAVAWGIFATYLLVAIQATSWTMRYLPRRLWHRVHVLSVPMLAIAGIHGFLAGADRSNRAVQWTAFTVTVGIVFLLAMRVLQPSRTSRSVAPLKTREAASA